MLSATVYGQVVEDTLRVYFHKESAVYNKNYRENEARAEEFFRKFNALTKISGTVILKVETVGVASPEGDPAFNEIISKARMAALRRIVRSKSDFPDSLITYKHVPADWVELAQFVEADDNVPAKEQTLDVIRNYEGDKIAKLLTVNYGRPYWYIYHNIYPQVRAARITYQVDLSLLVAQPEFVEEDDFEVSDDRLFADLQIDSTLGITIAQPVAKPAVKPNTKPAVKPNTKPVVKPVAKPAVKPIAKPVDQPVVQSNAQTALKIEVKTNAVGWGCGLMNVAAEVDVVPHLSVNVPFYYSGGYDYFKHTIKFRGIVLQPEVRYYPWLKNDQNNGFFAGAHLGLGWYNYALNGDYRIQDFGGNRPAFGGGLSVGYKTRFKKNPSWGVEFALGAGVYNVKYDIFYNEENGPYYKRGIQETWLGVDNAAVSFFYEFDIKKKGGKR